MRMSIRPTDSPHPERMHLLARSKQPHLALDSPDEIAAPSQVEVKIRLPDRAAYDKVAQVLAGSLQATHEQENYFFDGSEKQLNSQRAVLRLRFYDVDKKAVITVKVPREPLGLGFRAFFVA